MPDKQDKKTVIHAVVVVWIAVLCASMSLIFVRFSTCPPLVLAAWRKTMVIAIMAPFVFGKKSVRTELLHMQRKVFGWCVLSGCFLGLHFWTYFQAVQTTTVAAAQVLAAFEVIIVALIMFLTGKERYSKRNVLGIVIAMLGCAVVAYTGTGITAGSTLKGNLLALACAVFIAVYTTIGASVRSGLSNMVYTFVVYAASAILLNVLVLFSDYSYVGYQKRNLLIALLLAIVCSLLGHSLINWALKYVSPTLIAMFRSFQPVFAAVWAYLCFSELPTWNQFVGGICVIMGILIYTGSKKIYTEK